MVVIRAFNDSHGTSIGVYRGQGSPAIAGTGPHLATGGPVPGPRGAPVNATVHGGEYVLSADVVQAIKAGSTSRGRGGSTRGGNTFNIYNPVGQTSEKSVEQALRRSQYLLGVPA